MADTASDIRVEFDRLNGAGGMHFRFAYHHGPVFIPTDYRAMAPHWGAAAEAALASSAAFAAFMVAGYGPWWAGLPGAAERLSTCNAVRQILLHAPVT